MRRSVFHPGRARWRLLAACIAFAALLLPFTARAALTLDGTVPSYPLASVLLYLEDPTRTLTIEEASGPSAARFQPVAPRAGDINFGYSSSAYWLALPLKVPPDTHAHAHWMLEIAYSSLDHVELYLPRPGGGFDRQVSGDLQPFRDRPYPHRHLVFPLELQPGTEPVVYLRVESAGNLTIPATLWRPDALHRNDQQSYALLALYYGMLLALLLYNLLLFCSVRDPVFLSYVAFGVAIMVGLTSLNGFGNQFLWPDWPEWGNVALPSGMSAAGFFAAIFTRLFLDTRRRFPQLDFVVVAFAAAFAFSALSPAFASYHFAAILTSVTGLGFAATAVGIGLYCHTRGHPGARYFLLAWTLLLAGVAVLAMRNFGWLPTTTLTVYSMQIGSALEMLLLSFALADRINTLQRDKERASQDALSAQQEMVKVLVRSEQELETRVTERTAELVEANSLLHEKERELQHLAHHDHLTGLANRLLLDDRIEHAIARARRGGVGVGVLMIDLDGFKAVNDAHGHDAGDELLIAVAGRLNDCVRESDTVARLGGDEFIVVLEDLPDSAAAAVVAEKIVASVTQPVALATGPVQVSVSVGAAFFPEHANDRARLLKRADAAMYAAKSAGRNGWRMAGRPDTAGTAPGSPRTDH